MNTLNLNVPLSSCQFRDPSFLGGHPVPTEASRRTYNEHVGLQGRPFSSRLAWGLTTAEAVERREPCPDAERAGTQESPAASEPPPFAA